MTESYVTYAPDQDLLLRPLLHEWLPEGHLAYFISDTVDSLDLSAFHARYAGGGSRNQPFHPVMMVKVLIYGYATGTFSSRKLARKLHEDVGFRVLAAGNSPAHRTLSDFRANHLEELSELFVQVVRLAQECGFVKLGTVAIDGTKLKANASRHKAMSYERIRQSEAKLRAHIDELMERATSADAVERNEPELDIPSEIARREKRLATIAAAKERLEQRQREADEAKGRSEGDDRRPRKPDGTFKSGPSYKRDFGVPEDKAQENFTDPDSRIMKHGNGAHEQSYNGQTAIDAEKGIVVAAELTQSAVDSHQLSPMLDAIEKNCGTVSRQTLADTGYRGEAVFEELADRGSDLLVSLGREGRQIGKLDATKKPRTAAMAGRLQSVDGKAACRRRKHIVEAPNG